MKNLCREYTLPRSEEASRVRGWILGNTKIGPVLDVKVCLHQERYGIEIMVEFLVSRHNSFLGSNCEWNYKYVTETSENISLENVEHRVTGKHVAKAKPQPKPTVTLSPISTPKRNWIDINPERFRQYCFTVSKAMIRSLRHDPSIPPEDDGAVRFDDIMEEFKEKFDGALQWSINDWIIFLAKGGGPKKRFQYCLNTNSSKHFLYFRAIQCHSGGNLVDPASQDNVLLPDDFTEYFYHVGNVSEIHSIIRSGLIPGGRSLKRDRQSVFFTAVNPMDDDQSMEEIRCDSDKPRIAPYKKVLGDLIKIHCIGARRKDCNFIKHDHTQSFSTTHFLRSVLRKRYA